jgi:hypothetical protein
MPAPIAIFTYNRPEHFRQTVDYLKINKEAKESNLYIFSDGPKQEKDKKIVEAIRAYAHTITGFKSVKIMESDRNMGLKASIREGISQVLSEHESVIVIEDDVCVNSNFLQYHNQCLVKYRNNQQLWSMSGFVIPEVGQAVKRKTKLDYFMTQRASSWGWSTWKDRWEQVEWDEKILFGYLKKDDNYKKYYHTGGDKIRMLLDCFEKKNNSWAIIWDFNHFMQNTYCLYPSRSFIRNIGLDNTGVHSKPKAEYDVKLEDWDFNAGQLPAQPESPDYAKYKFRLINRKFYRDILDVLRYNRLKKKF